MSGQPDQTTTRSARVDHLDGIRFLAIAAVLGTHWVDRFLPVGRGGGVGVDLFFVLSGYIITTILWRRTPRDGVRADYGRFLLNRVRRLYPALLGMVVVVVALAGPVGLRDYSVTDVARQGLAVLAQVSWLDAVDGGDEQIFGHTWSLGIEWAFYLLWPVLLLAARRDARTARRLAALAGVLALVLYAASFALDDHWFSYGPVGRSSGLLVGSALALVLLARPTAVRTPGRIPVRVLDVTALAAVAAFTVYVLVGFPTLDDGMRWFGVPLADAVGVYLVWFGYVRTAGPAFRLLTMPALTAVGRASYSLYLWHIPGLFLVVEAPTGWPRPVAGLVGLLATMAVTVVSYRLLERPFTGSRGALLTQGGSTAGPRVGSRGGE